MGIPIEEVFAGIEFATIEKKSTSPLSSDAEDNDIITEEPYHTEDDIITEELYISASENQPGPSHNGVTHPQLDADHNHTNNTSNCLGLDGFSEDLT